MDKLPDGVAHFGKRLTTYSENLTSSIVELQFSDGSSATCDILIGCDGIKSGIRRQMFQSLAESVSSDYHQYIEPVWSGTIAYRGLIPIEELNEVCSDKPHRTIMTPMMVTTSANCALFKI